jgi:hypothetical protein
MIGFRFDRRPARIEVYVQRDTAVTVQRVKHVARRDILLHGLFENDREVIIAAAVERHDLHPELIASLHDLRRHHAIAAVLGAIGAGTRAVEHHGPAHALTALT